MRTLANVTYPSSGIVGQQMSLFLLRSVRAVSFSYGCGTQERSGVGGECAIQESVRQSRTARLVANVRHGELIGARPWKSAFPQTEGIRQRFVRFDNFEPESQNLEQQARHARYLHETVKSAGSATLAVRQTHSKSDRPNIKRHQR
ncbi:hypothetical protein HN011_000229 [Eciton burchellii]|nr:hypothetical protein HN011_000229 [Eciton burchellii]